jgi:uncharacterized protein YggT (Ycf19 family)
MIWGVRNVLLTILNLIIGFISLILGFRILFKLVSASSATPIVQWVNNLSDKFIYPFHGLFPDIPITAFSTLDIVALISLLAYSLIGYLIGLAITSLVPVETVTTHHHEKHIV